MDTPPNSSIPDKPSFSSWQAALEAGYAEEALGLYLAAGASTSADVLGDLQLCSKLRTALRDKAWSKALDYSRDLGSRDLSDYDLSGHDLSKLPLELEVLQTDLAAVAEAGAALTKHDSDAVRPLLAGVTSPLLTAEVNTLLGTAAVYDNDTAEARRLFEAALHHDSRHFRALTNLGNIALEAGEVDAAIAAYERALRLNDSFANAHHNLGVAYRRKGQFGKSVRSLRKAQSASQRDLREQARADLKRGNPQLKRALRWLLYSGAALLLYTFLRAGGFV